MPAVLRGYFARRRAWSGVLSVGLWFHAARAAVKRSAVRRAAASSATTSSSVFAGCAPIVANIGHRAGDIEKTDPALHEGFHSNLVRRVQDRWRTTARTQRIARQAQRGEALGVGRHEIESRKAGKIEARR